MKKKLSLTTTHIIMLSFWGMILLHKRMGISNRLLLQDAFNLNSLSRIIRFVKRVMAGTFLVEGVGALLYMLVFIPRFGRRGIWISVFTAVSAFCNAGMDIIGENSLCEFVTDPIINLTTSILIILGGIGYIVWWDVLQTCRKASGKHGRIFRNLTLHSKIAIATEINNGTNRNHSISPLCLPALHRPMNSMIALRLVSTCGRSFI